jgi:superfamily II DNA or RNA helicase
MPIPAQFQGTLRDDQLSAVNAMLAHDTGVLCAPTAFGKTVVAAALIAQRGVSTLVLVHRTELMLQWQERLQAFLGADRDIVGLMRNKTG